MTWHRNCFFTHGFDYGVSSMKQPIIVVDADKKQAAALCAMLEEQDYRAVRSESLMNLDRPIIANSSRVVIVDLDTIPVDNRGLRHLKTAHPSLRVLAVSARRFHPELQEAMSSHIYACIRKPIDPDEVAYLLRSIFCEESQTDDYQSAKETKNPC